MMIFFFVILALFLIWACWHILFSKSDEIPYSATFDDLPKPSRTNLVTQTPASPLPEATDQISTEQSNKQIYSNRNQILFLSGTPQESTTLEEIFEKPELISFDELRNQYRFGCKPYSTLHFIVCTLFYGFILIFKMVLFTAHCLGYIFFNLLFRLFIQGILRLIVFIIRIFFQTLAHIFDSV